MTPFFESYGATPASNKILTYQLRRKIKSRLVQFKPDLKRKMSQKNEGLRSKF